MDDNESGAEEAAGELALVPVNPTGRWGVFRGEISLGNLLIVAGMIGTGVVGIYTVGGNVQRLQDSIEQVQLALTHETQLRTQSEAEFQRQFTASDREHTEQIAALVRQEASDVANVSQTLRDVRTDLRALLQSSGTGRPLK